MKPERIFHAQKGTAPRAGVKSRTATGVSAPLPPTQHGCDEKAVQPVLGRVLGVDELAAFFGCSTEKIKRRARTRDLPAFKFGKSWYVREEDLHRYIQCAVESTRNEEER